MHGLEAQRLQDEHVERALNDVGIRIRFLHKSSEKDSASSPHDCQDVTIIRNTKLRLDAEEESVWPMLPTEARYERSARQFSGNRVWTYAIAFGWPTTYEGIT
jgi:hypothetical protein